VIRPCTLGGHKERFIHNENLAQYRRLLAASERDPARDVVQHNGLLKLLAEEEAKDVGPRH
jgi:hypothetical protein